MGVKKHSQTQSFTVQDPARHTLTFRCLPTRSASLRTPTTSSSSYSLCTFSLLPLSASLPLSSSAAIVVPALLSSSSCSSSSAASSPCPSPFIVLLLAQVFVVWPLLCPLAAAVAGQLEGALQRLRGLCEPTHTSCTGLVRNQRGESVRQMFEKVMITVHLFHQLYIILKSFMVTMK